MNAEEISRQWKPNAVIVNLLQSTEDGGDVVELKGYAGPLEGETVRLYDDLSLSRWIDLEAESILAVKELPDHEDGDVRVYVRGSAPLVRATSLDGRRVSVDRRRGSVQMLSPSRLRRRRGRRMRALGRQRYSCFDALDAEMELELFYNEIENDPEVPYFVEASIYELLQLQRRRRAEICGPLDELDFP